MIDRGLVSRVLRRRRVDPELERKARARGLPGAVARIVAARGLDMAGALSDATRLPDPFLLPDMRAAVARLARALDRREVIVILADHDMDGTASAAILYSALREVFGHPGDRIHVVVSHRLKEGYGMTPGVAERIARLEPRPNLVITADCGSSDGERVAWLAGLEPRIDTIVTDHHGTGEDMPSAVAFVNPWRPSSEFPDTAVAGCGVAWIAMVALARYLNGPQRHPRERALARLLDFVAVGTVADCVDLSSPLNRYIVRYGLSLLDRGLRPCWKVTLDRWFQYPVGKGLTGAINVAFQLAPKIAATGRLDESRPGLLFLLASDENSALEHAEVLEAENEARKKIQAELTASALRIAEHQVEAGAKMILVELPEGHIGVQGIVASRLVDAFARPAGVFSPRRGEGGELTEWSGSLRGGDYIHVREWILKLRETVPSIVLGGGGHEAAGGLRVAAGADFGALRAASERVVPEVWLEGAPPLGRLISKSDGELPVSCVDFQLMSALQRVEPWGRGYEPPAFDCVARIKHVRVLRGGLHLALRVDDGHGEQDIVWFGAREPEDVEAKRMPVAVGDQVRMLYAPSYSCWRGRIRVSLHARHVSLIKAS